MLLVERKQSVSHHTRHMKLGNSKKNYDDDKVFSMFSNEDVSIDQNLKEKRIWSDNDIHKIHNS